MSRWIAQKVLDAMPADGTVITTAELAEATGLSRTDVKHAITTLSRRNLVSLHKKGRYRLLSAGRAAKDSAARIDSGNRAKRDGVQIWEGTFRERIWGALRQQLKATAPDLVELAATGSERNPENSARKYLWALLQAGYVVVLPKREPGTALTSSGFQKYLLLRDTGPKPPIYRERRRSVFDQNTREEHLLDREEAAAQEGAP